MVETMGFFAWCFQHLSVDISQYHEKCRLGTVEEEADESLFWLEMIEQAGLVPADDLRPLQKEADELIAIVVYSINTARRNK